MATGTSKPHCIRFLRDRATSKCEGCSQDFCFNHLTDHCQELRKQLDKIEMNRDVYQQTLNEKMNKPEEHPVIKQIDQWENDSIRKIKQTAKECREIVFQRTNKHINQMETNLTKLNDQIKEVRKENDFNEIDLNQSKQKLTQIKNELDQSPNISIQQDSTSFINKSSVTVSCASLANPKQPSGFLLNPQQVSIRPLPQRPIRGAPPNNSGSPFGGPYSSQPSVSGSAPRFSFINSSSTDAPAFLFTNPQQGNSSNITFNSPTINSQVQKPIPSFTVTPSTQNQRVSNNNKQFSSPSTVTSTNSPNQRSTSNESMKVTEKSIFTLSKKSSDIPTPISQPLGSSNQEQEQPDVRAPLADNSLMEKQINTKRRDPNTIVADHNDSASPLYRLKSFQELNLNPDLLKGIYNMGFKTLTTIQQSVLPNLLGNPPKNIIAQSQYGTGKTAAFSLAIISCIDPKIQSPQALILVPTFELAKQIISVIQTMAQFLPYIKVADAVRQSKTNITRRKLLTEPIVVGTPGTVEDWCFKWRVINLSTLRMFCVDDAELMITTQGFQQMCVNLVQGLNDSSCQVMLFSTVYSDEVMNFAKVIVQNSVVLRFEREKQMLPNIRQFFIRCYGPEQKYNAIEQIFASLTLGQTTIFCGTRSTARDLYNRMTKQGHSVRELTGALDDEQYANITNTFCEGVFRVLISTKLNLDDIHSDDISLVINYDMPVTTTFDPDFKTYLHRIGLCGRFGKLGYAFNLIGSEKDFNKMKAIEADFSHPINEITIEAISNLEQDTE